ncbi:DIS3-like exonuclease 2 [Anastrepha obliqua]|uniref:DIS3-like exonuclease 2 n=1 Tax=Anastrepha obliqua TaxID=95512 RepID=UPI00240A942C|nr:DIS3-like exonuclease 2 [Anastrepha obliqua]
MEQDCGEDMGNQDEQIKNVAEKGKVKHQGDDNVSIENNGNENQAVSDLPRTQIDSASSTIEIPECINEGSPTVPQVETNNISIDSEKQSAASLGKKNDEQESFTQEIVTLQEKTKKLLFKLGLHRHELQRQITAVSQSPQTCHANDRLAAKAMTTLRVNTSCNVDHSESTNTATHSATDINLKPGNSTVESRRTTRRELQEQLEGLQELLHQLTLKNPQLKDRVQELAQSNPKLRQLDIFTTGLKKDCTTVGASIQTPHTSKQRRESEVSSSSTTTSQKDTKDSANSVQGAYRKRSQRKRKNKAIKPAKSQASEMESLSKYINNIVSDYLGVDQKEKANELEFKGTFEDLEAHAQKLVQAGIGRIVEEEIRINRKNNRQSFITMCGDREGTERDGIILLPVARRYAFDGDTVRAFVMNIGTASPPTNVKNGTALKAEKNREAVESAIKGGKENSFCLADDEDPFDDTESPDSDVDVDPNELDASAVIVPDNCPKSFVISIVKQTQLHEVVGTISFKNSMKLNDETKYYKLKPYDMRVPMVYIPVEACASHLTSDNKADICGLLYLVRITGTDINGHCIGELIHPVGKVGNMEAEMKAILLHNGLKNIKPFEQRFNDVYAQPDPAISATDLHGREDLRGKCVFTIDPLTARDLDDAVSMERLGDDLYEVGVHISDVTRYLHEDSELDNIVKERATSIYLVNEVIHMLPQKLCFKCSLLPGEDKFAFSVFWHMNIGGEILGQPRFTRTVINSCVQLAYEHAQKVIDNPDEDFEADDFPTICNGFSVPDICWRIKILNTIAKQLRQKRFDGGALSINNPKLRFNLDPKTGEPLSYEIDVRQDANLLIEEFMLLANQSVARFIYDRFPNIAILRNHAAPLSKSMKNLREKLAGLGMELDCSNSKTVYSSMQKICREAKDPQAMDACLSVLLTKPMARAKYFCSEGKSEGADLWHYALSIPIYTHFTSPIRRYPDILVHRVLAGALNYCPPPKRTPDELHMLAKICNDQKYNAKNAGDESINLFFKRYIKEKQSIVLRAAVTEVFQHLLNVITIETGHSISINYKMQKVLVDTSNAPAYVLISERNSKNPPVKLQLFSTLEIKLVIWDEKVCGFFVSPDLKQRQFNSIELSKKKQQTSSANNSISECSGTRKQRRTSQRSAQELNNIQSEQHAATANAKSKSKHNNEKRIYAVQPDNESN